MAIVPKNSPAKRKAAKPASTRQFFSAIDPYYKKLKAACKAGVNPKNPAMQYTNPTAHALGLSLLGHPNMDEKELGKDWQTWAETYPEKADRIRQEVFDMKAADNRRFVLHFHDPNMKPKTAPGKPFILLHPDYTDGLVPKEMISCKTKDAPAPAAPTEKEARKVGRPRGSKNRTKVEMSAVKQIKADKKQKRENRRPAQKQKAVAGEVSEDDASDLELDEDATNDEPEATPDDESDDDSIKDSSEQIENDDDTDAGSVAGCSEDAGDDSNDEAENSDSEYPDPEKVNTRKSSCYYTKGTHAREAFDPDTGLISPAKSVHSSDDVQGEGNDDELERAIEGEPDSDIEGDDALDPALDQN